MIEFDSTQLRHLADLLDAFERIEGQTGIQLDGHRGAFELTVPATGIDGAVDLTGRAQIVEAARTVRAELPSDAGGVRYVVQVGD